MLDVYRRARLATMTIIGQPLTASDDVPGVSNAAPEVVDIATA